MIGENESLLALSELPKYLERRDGRRPSVATLYRWISRGLNGVQLEVLYRAGRPYSSVEALRRFDEAVTVAKLGQVPRVMKSSPAIAAAAHERAKRRLAEPKRRA